MDKKIIDNKICMENSFPLIKNKKLAVTSKYEASKDSKSSKLLINFAVLSMSLMTFTAFWFTNIYNRLLLEKIILRNGSEMLEYWTMPPIDPIIKVYVFNYTNVFEIESGVEKIIKLKEVGPYVYRERIEKTRLNFEADKITFNENRTHTFLPHLSGKNLSENDVITVPNIALISGIPNVKALGFFAELGYKTILAATKPKEFQNLTISKYFLGYTDDFMGLISKVKWDFNPEDVGILAPRRGVSKQSVTVFSGTKDVNKIGRVYAIENKTKLGIWKTEDCNMVTGSDGVIFGPSKVQNKEDVAVYLPNICRSLPLTFDKEVKIMNGMRSYRYKAPYGTFSSPESTPENKYYCELRELQEKQIDGVLDVSKCIDGNPPIFISHPHFMEGDLKLSESFHGLNPNESLHNSFAFIHPRLSVPFFGVSRMQINLKLNHFGKYYKKFPDGITMPLAWIETTTEEFPEKIMSRLFLSTVVVDFIEDFFKFGSLISLVASSLLLIFQSFCNLKYNAMIVRKAIKSCF